MHISMLETFYMDFVFTAFWNIVYIFILIFLIDILYLKNVCNQRVSSVFHI